MSIVSLDKVTVYGTSVQQEAALDGLQRLGCLHLVNLRDRSPARQELISKEAREALRYLEASPKKRRKTSKRARYDRDTLVDELLSIKQRAEQLGVERDELREAILKLEPWGDFRLPDETTIAPHRFWFYLLPVGRLADLPADVTWHLAKRDNQFAYVVLLSPEPPPSLPFSPVDLDRRPLSELRERLEAVEEQLDELNWRRATLSNQRGLLRQDLDAADDRTARAAAAAGLLDDNSVFALQGWVPRQATDEVRRFAVSQELAVTIEPAKATDNPPTLLRNPDRLAGAEGCVTFYITPNYHAWDPTTIVFFSFSLFFAMIVSDAGYGLAMAAILSLLWRRLGQSQAGTRFRNLLLGIVSTSIIYGIIVGSYFGCEPVAGSILDVLRVKIDGQPMMSNQTAMMAIAVAIGVVHLSLANGISAWRARKSSRCLGHLGWAGVMVGSFLIGGGVVAEAPALMNAGTILASAGALCILLFSSQRPLATWNPVTHVLRLVDGLMQFTQVSKAFGDSLSYLRLFALGLASAQLAVTFNGLASDAFRAGGLGVLLAILIMVIGHTINFLLAMMGGVVHGLRLNCIEFFNWSLSEEGYPFEPFRKKAEI